MLRINLLPIRQLKRRAAATTQLASFAMVFIALIFILGFVGLLQMGQMASIQRKVNDLKAEEARLAPVIAEVKQLEQQQLELQRKIDVIKKLRQESSLTVHVLDEIAKTVDNKRMWLNSLSQQGGGLELKGIALDNETIAQFMETIKLSPYIKGVTLSSSTLTKVGERDFKDFSLSCTVGFPGSLKSEAAVSSK